MANYYVDLDLGGAVQGDGSEGSPFSTQSYQNNYPYSSGDIFYLKGSDAPAYQINFQAGAQYLPWENVPWRLSLNANSAPNGEIHGAVLLISAAVSFTATLYNTYAIFTSSGGYATFDGHCYGCLIDMRGDAGFYLNPGSTFTDCAIKYAPSVGAIDTVMVRCATTVPPVAASGTYTECQQDWVAPTLPDWDAIQSEFDTSVLFADVDTPPQPGSPPYTNYTTDLWGNARTGIGTGLMGSASTPPVWASTYPKAGTVAGTTAEILAQTDQDGTAYYVTLADGATAPSSAEVKAGTGASGATAVDSGSVALTADTEASVISTGLTSETAYDIYVVAENGPADLQASPSLINVTTTDVTAPSWIATYPKATNITSSTVIMLLKLDDSGTVYYVTKDHGTAAPTAAAIKASPDGSTAVVANTEKSLSIVGLGYNKSYDIYLVAEDSNLVLQATPANVEVTTAQSNPPAMSPDAFIGMPPKAGNTGGNLQHSDTKLGNPLGDKNDNSSGDNKADGTEHGLPMRTVRGGGGGTVGISSRPSWLH